MHRGPATSGLTSITPCVISKRSSCATPVRALSARLFRLPTTANQFFHELVAVIALYFDTPVAAGSAGPATLLEFRRERIQFNGRKSEPGNDGDANRARWRRFPWCSLAADALSFRPQAIRAALADAGRVNDAATVTNALASRLIHVQILVECMAVTRSLHSLARQSLDCVCESGRCQYARSDIAAHRLT